MRPTRNGSRLAAHADINLQAAADLSRLAVSHFSTAADPGRIVNVASRAAFRGDSPQHWHYAASKAALIGMTKTIARGYAADGILAFAVAPGFTVSEMTEEYLQGRGGAQIVADIPLGRVATHRRGRRGDPLAGDRGAGLGDRQRDRRQRRELCSLASPRGRGARHSARQDAAVEADAPIETAGPPAQRQGSDDWTKPAPPVQIFGNIYWSAPAASPRS